MKRKLHFQFPFLRFRNCLKTILLFFIIQMLTFADISAQNKSAELDNLMKYCFTNNIFNGTILVSDSGKVIYRKAFGLSNNETKQSLIPESSFDLASISKQFTAMGIMLLKERNKLSYEDKLIKYFPEFPAYANEITIKNLLTHTSGMPNYQRYTDKENLANSEIFKILINRDKSDFKAGDKFAYNNGGYVILALIIEKVSGLSLNAFLKQNIFDPLKMRNTWVNDDSKLNIKHRAVGYNCINELDDFTVSHTGSTSMFSNADDLSIWLKSLETYKIVSKKILDEAFLPITLNDGSISAYGFGWRITEDEQQKAIEHSGSDFGYRTFIKKNLTKNSSYILLTNHGDAIALREINLAVDNILASNPYVFPKIPVFSKLKESLENNVVEKSIEITKKAIKAAPNEFVFDDDAINELGYKYLNEKKINDALSLFKFNAELNPNSSNVYDSLGEIYLIVNDTAKAVENYKKSITLNPNNSNAIKVLKNIGITSAEESPEVIVSEDILRTYTGKYQLNQNYFFTVTVENKQLFIQGSGEAITTIFPISQNRFYSKIVTAQFTFNKNSDGRVDSLTLNMGGDVNAKKVDLN